MSEIAIFYPKPSPARTPLNAEVTTGWFTRRELDRLLRLYGRMVAAGEWRDYAVSDLPDRAIFAVHRRAREVPIYRIEKLARSQRRQPSFQIIAATGLILHRGHCLEDVLRPFELKLLKTLG